METVIVALWVALSVFVVWYGAATYVLRRKAAGSAQASLTAQENAEEDAEALRFLEAQSEGLGSAWDTIREADRPAG